MAWGTTSSVGVSGGVEVYGSMAVITAVATTVIVIGARKLLIEGLLVVVIAAEDSLVLLTELGGLVL
jgi:hypothetical protein